MSDVMLLGVLRMPIDPATAGIIEMSQYIARGQEAAERIEADAEIIALLEREDCRLSAYVDALEQKVKESAGKQALLDIQAAIQEGR